MRHLVRLPKPAVLLQREVNWTNAFINSGNIRPNNVQYGHLEIRTQLHNISFKKCFKKFGKGKKVSIFAAAKREGDRVGG